MGNLRVVTVLSAAIFVLSGCADQPSESPGTGAGTTEPAGTAPAGTEPAGDGFPERPIEVIVPFPPGGSADTTARAIAEIVQGELGQSLVILNREGGGGTVGATEAAAAEPDGYTMLVMTIGPGATQPHLNPDVTYDVDSFEPITFINNQPLVLVVNESSEFQTTEELLSAAATEELNFAAAPPGGVPHLGPELLLQTAEVTAAMVPFQGTGPATQALLGNQIDAAMLPATEVATHVEAGTLRALGVSSAERFEPLPDVPTLSEEGIDLVVAIWNGLVVPAGVPDDRYNTLVDAFRTAVESDEYQQVMDDLGAPLEYVPPEEFREIWESDYDRFGQLIVDLRDAGRLD